MTFQKHNLLTVIVILLIPCAFATSVFFRGFDQEIFAPALLMVLSASGVMLAQGWRGGWSFPSAGCTIFLGLFWIWMGISLTWSTVPYISTVFTLIIGSMPLLFFTILQHPRADGLIREQMIGVNTFIILIALWAMVQFIFLSDLAGPRIRHPMLNPNNLAVLLTMGAFPLLLVFTRAKGVRMAIIGVLLGLVICAMLVTQSRGGMLGLVAGGLLFFACCAPVLKAEWKRFVIFICLLGITTGIIFLTLAGREDSIRILDSGTSGMASVNERFLLLHSAIKMLIDHPFSGIGLGVFYLAFPPYRHFNDLSDGFFVHIDPLQFAIEMGIIAPILFYGFCTAVLVRTIKALKESRNRPDARLRMIVPFCSLLALLINAHVNFDLYMLPALILSALLLAAWYKGTEEILGPSRWMFTPGNRIPLLFLSLAFTLLFVITPVWVVRAGFQVHESGRAAAALQDGDMEAAKQHTATALKYGIRSYYRAYYLDALWRGKTLQDHYDSLSPEEREDLFTKALQQLNSTLAYNPYNVQALNHEALFYYLSWQRMNDDGLSKAVELLETAVRIDPINFDVRIGLAMMLDRQGFPGKAIAVLEEGNQWDAAQKYAPPTYRALLIGLKKKIGDEEGARKMEAIARERDEALLLRIKKQARIDHWLHDRMKIFQ